MITLLKKKARTYNNTETLQEIHSKAKTTIEVLNVNMVTGNTSVDRIFEFYNEVTRQNVIKLLIRCKKMYEARAVLKKILHIIIKKEKCF